MGEGVEITEQKRPIRFGIRQLLIVVAVIGAFLAIVVPVYREAFDSAERVQCSNRLKMIGLGLQNYHDVHESFPAAWQVDGMGKPAHSWRIAIWPYMESNPYSGRYNYSEPWNGPNNSQLANLHTPYWLRCPRNNLHKSGMTSYVAVVGPGTAWPGTGYLSMRDLKDGAANTVMIVEIANSDIHWMEPRDLPIGELMEWLKPGHKPNLGSSHRNGEVIGCLAVFADTHTEYFPRSELTEKRLRALLSPAGNDNADIEE